MAKRDTGKRVDRDPIGAEDAWLRATQESTGERYDRPALAKALGEPLAQVYPRDGDPTINGYRAHNPSLIDPPGPHDKPDAGGRPDPD